MTLRIAGAGLAGLLAAHAWPQAEVYEAQSEPRAHHKALLRFRSDAVARLIGIEFHPVTVRKGIWFNGRFVPPSIKVANLYSQKILGSLEAERSIWNLEPVQRFIAPETLYEQMVEGVGKRLHWGAAFDYGHHSRCFMDDGAPVISTAPLPVVLNALPVSKLDFKRAPILVLRYRVPKCAVNQTVYFPQPEQPVYRASITGDLMIIECAKGQQPDTLQITDVMEAFGIYSLAEQFETVEQSYGKIVPLESGARKALLHQLTVKHGVFSLGRFATWRNVLLDDVVEDIAVIRRLLRSSEYEHKLHFS